jgi:hypothetical protein
MNYITRLLACIRQEQEKVFGTPEGRLQRVAWLLLLLLLLYSERTREYNINNKI